MVIDLIELFMSDSWQGISLRMLVAFVIAALIFCNALRR